MERTSSRSIERCGLTLSQQKRPELIALLLLAIIIKSLLVPFE